MKKFKTGFSLAELLIALGIISVISTMGITIGKKGVERAYNQYFYTGYNGLYSIIYDTNDSNITMYDNISVGKCPSSSFRSHIELYGIKTGSSVADDPLNYGTTRCEATFKATNNVAIIISKLKEADNGELYAPMTISVPAPNSKRAYYEVYYFPNYLDGIIIPSTTTNSAKNVISLQNRPDILPFYIDNGESGRLVQVYNPVDEKYEIRVYDEDETDESKKYKLLSETGAYTPFSYESFQNAYCKAGFDSIDGVIDCTGITANTNISDLKLTIRPANPKKVF